MTSLIFWLFGNVLGQYCIPTKFHCSQKPNGRVNPGKLFCPPLVHNRVYPDPVQNRVNSMMVEIGANIRLIVRSLKVY